MEDDNGAYLNGEGDGHYFNEPQTEGNEENYGHHNYSASGISNIRVSVDDSAIDNYRDNHSDSYPTLRRVSSQSSHFSPKSFDDSYFGDMRMQKIAQAEAAIRKEMFKDCTFRPQIKNLPTAYGPLKENGTPFVTRVLKWQKEKEQDLQNKMQLSIKNVEDQCSFKPKINKNSVIAMKEIRGESPERANERLFRSHLTIHEQKQKMVEEVIVREEQQLQQECTFQPQLFTRGKSPFDGVQPRYNKVHDPNNIFEQQKASSKRDVLQYASKECTFTPKVNQIRPSMVSAKLYCSTNVVDRLTRPIEASPNHKSGKENSLIQAFDESFDIEFQNKSSVIDAATYIGSLQTGINQQIHADEQENQSTSGANRSNRKSSSTPKSFENFLQRQQIVLKKREENIKHVERSITPNFKPKIAKKSVELLSEKKAPDFMTRLERDVKRRLSTEQQQEILQQHEAQELTFKPAINRKAELLRSRSSFEMSYGDQLRKDTKIKMLKLQTEQAELADATFQPKISSKAKEIGRSKLQLSDDPSHFLQWVNEKKKHQEQQRQNELLKREEDQLKDCTFKPSTTECPAYIKRIAESISKMKSARGNAVRVQSKPEWK